MNKIILVQCPKCKNKYFGLKGSTNICEKCNKVCKEVKHEFKF